MINFRSKGRLRTVEPYLLGYNMAGHLELSAWQMLGGSGVGWRGFLVGELHDLAAIGTTFQGVRVGYNPNDPRMQIIVCRVGLWT